MLGRVVLRSTADGNRSPQQVRAIIEDPHNLGVGTYVNEVGELFFTLPLNHPQVGECEPFKTHWAVQRWNGSAWVELHKYAYGLLTDLDFTDDEVVVYGMDYLGLLSLSLDTRTPEERDNGTYKNFNKGTREGGAKYKDEKISYILKEQLDLARQEEESLTGFIRRGHVDDMDTKISIYVSFRQRLDFIKGLLDSYRQGTGVGSRVSVGWDPYDTRWEWRIDANPGLERPGLRLEYGGLIQGFRILTYEDFATRAMGIGVILDSTKPIYRMYPNEGVADSYVANYGNMQVASVWEDLSDRNDLKRRVRQLYAERSRIGKRVALGIRVHSLLPFQGYDLSDHVPLDIERYALDTKAFGSGWWTIWGTEWRLYPDGHDELTLVVRPREDVKPADPDILDSDPVVKQPGLCWGEGPPVAGEECDCGEDGYVDVLTGIVYVCRDGEFTGPVGPITVDQTVYPIDIFPEESLYDGNCGFVQNMSWELWEGEGITGYHSEDPSFDSIAFSWGYPAGNFQGRVRDSADGYHEPHIGTCGAIGGHYGRSVAQLKLHLLHPLMPEGRSACMTGRISFDVVVLTAGLALETPRIGVFGAAGAGADGSSYAIDPDLVDDPHDQQAAGVWRNGGQWTYLGGSNWRLDVWIQGFLISGADTWITLAGLEPCDPEPFSTPICATGPMPRATGVNESYEYDVSVIFTGPYAPQLGLSAWTPTITPLERTLDLRPGTTYSASFGTPPWLTPFDWESPTMNDDGIYEQGDDQLRVKTNRGSEQDFSVKDQNGDAPWRNDFTTSYRFSHPGGGPTITDSHAGFIWEGTKGYAEAYAEFGGADFPAGVRVVGVTDEFVALSIPANAMHTLKMRIANGKVYAKVWADTVTEPSAWQVSTSYDTTRKASVAELHIIVGAGIDDVPDGADPMANPVIIESFAAQQGPTPGQNVEDVIVGIGDGENPDFEAPSPVVSGTLVVHVDGLLVVPTSIDPTTGAFTLDAAPSPGAVVVVDYTSA